MYKHQVSIILSFELDLILDLEQGDVLRQLLFLTSACIKWIWK